MKLVRDQVRHQPQAKVESRTWIQVNEYRLWYKIEAYVYEPVWDQIWDQIKNKVFDHVWYQSNRSNEW